MIEKEFLWLKIVQHNVAQYKNVVSSYTRFFILKYIAGTAESKHSGMDETTFISCWRFYTWICTLTTNIWKKDLKFGTHPLKCICCEFNSELFNKMWNCPYITPNSLLPTASARRWTAWFAEEGKQNRLVTRLWIRLGNVWHQNARGVFWNLFLGDCIVYLNYRSGNSCWDSAVVPYRERCAGSSVRHQDSIGPISRRLCGEPSSPSSSWRREQSDGVGQCWSQGFVYYFDWATGHTGPSGSW